VALENSKAPHPSIYLVRPVAIEKHANAPLFAQRELYLANLCRQGTNKHRVRAISASLLHVVRLLDLQTPRSVGPAEIREAATKRAKKVSSSSNCEGTNSKQVFMTDAGNFLLFSGLLDESHRRIPHFDKQFQNYLHAMRTELSLAASTVAGYGRKVACFLRWLASRETSFSVTVAALDAYIALKQQTCSPRGIISEYNSLRHFLGYAARMGWCSKDLRASIRVPSIPRSNLASEGPDWREVRRLLDWSSGNRACDYRAQAITILCSVYGLRGSEVCRLRLNDFDWYGMTFRLTRSKNRLVQHYPIQSELGNSLSLYIASGRPVCECPTVFVSLSPPYRSISPGNLSQMIGHRMKRCGINSTRRGAHGLRHSCATYLLRTGSTLREIADFLGHKDTRTVSVYAKHDIASLEEIALFDLGAVL